MTDTQDLSILEAMRDPANKADPYPFYKSLLEKGALLRLPFGAYALTRHADCFNVLRDARFSSSDEHKDGYENIGEMIKQLGYEDLLGLMTRIMLFADPPDHTRLRRLVSKAFTPKAIEAMRPRIASIVDDILDDVDVRGEIEVVDDLAFKLPVTVISEMLGVPMDDHEHLRSLTAVAVAALDPSDNFEMLLPAAEGLRAMRTYFDELVEKRRGDLGDDLLSAMIAAEDEGDRLSHDELLDTMLLLFAAGHETTVNLISGGMLNLLTHPAELERLVADPSLITTTVEELLRFGPPVQFTARTTTTEVELCGQTMPKGTELVVMLAAANRDPSVFPDPDALDIGREDNRHLSFGGGIHLCLGAPLARVEAQEAIGRLVRRFPGLRLVDSQVEWKPTTTIRGPARLPLTW
ncbi:MAG TPA: cytochrome P450 [Acidimicrobiales bacterium]|nr:cytochrome P450 [Acidimicrobiales bacterium]